MVSDFDDVYVATIDELVDNFRCALLAILPMASRAIISYEDDKQYDHWDSLAESLYDAFVRDPADADRVHRRQDQLRVARYDRPWDYHSTSWLTANEASPYNAVFVRFLSQDTPFDTIQVVDIDPRTHQARGSSAVPASEIRLVLYRRYSNGDSVVVTKIEADD